jgi:ribosome-associated heat shock protein Hsp15
MGEAQAPSRRLDKWLWHARVTKSRTGAQGLIASGQVRVNRLRALRSSQDLDIGDILTIAAGSRIRVLKVAGFAQRRGPPGAARLLYEELSPALASKPDPAAG